MKILQIIIIVLVVLSALITFIKNNKQINKFKSTSENKKDKITKKSTSEYLKELDEGSYAVTDKFKEFIEEVKQESLTNYIKLDLEYSENLGITESKIGGLPYISKLDNVVLDDEDDPMYLLAQINCKDLPANNIYPEKGLLQFYIKADDMLGLETKIENQNTCENHKVIYIENIDESVTINEIKSKYILDKEKYDDMPIDKNHSLKIKFSLAQQSGNNSDSIFLKYFINKYNQIFEANISSEYDLAEEELDLLSCEFFDLNTQIGGYAGFTQEDPRGYEDFEDKGYEILLLQIAEEENYITWGDCGVANFFITKEDMKNRDFSRVLYNWDCY